MCIYLHEIMHPLCRCAIITADVNECQFFPNGFCSQVCVNKQGSFHVTVERDTVCFDHLSAQVWMAFFQ